MSIFRPRACLATVNLEMALLSRIFSLAIDFNELETNPCLMGHSNVQTTQRYVRATERNKREAVQAAMLSSRGHDLATRVNAITQNHAVA
jgi:integrase